MFFSAETVYGNYPKIWKIAKNVKKHSPRKPFLSPFGLGEGGVGGGDGWVEQKVRALTLSVNNCFFF